MIVGLNIHLILLFLFIFLPVNFDVIIFIILYKAGFTIN